MLTIHIVPNAHLDPVWLWDWREGMNEGIATCQAIVDLMTDNPDVTFTRNEAIIYQHIERHAPDLFKRIRGLIEEGRWEIVGGAMLQPDTNMGAGEAFVRQYLYGQAYFHDRFGIVPNIAYQVDSFGHAAGLPQIYKAAGCRFVVQCRPSQVEMPTPSRLFRWRDRDGSEVLVANLESYGIEVEAQDPFFTLTGRLNKVREQAPPGMDSWPLLAGMGNHGGGLNREHVAEIRKAMANPPEGTRIVFSTMRRFFESISVPMENIPVVEGELQYCFRGCYTSTANIKRTYRDAENLIRRAERWSTVAALSGQHPYPNAAIRKTWLDVLFNQFHDILPGSSIQRACDEAIDHLGRARHEARGIENDAALTVFGQIDTSQHKGQPVLLFNPHATAFKGAVEVEWLLEYRPLGPAGDRRTVRHVEVVSPSGQILPTQCLPTECKSRGEWRMRSCFEPMIPACGYAVYWLRPTKSPLAVDAAVTTESEPALCMDNGLVRVEKREGENGIRVVDTHDGREWFTAPAAAGLVVDDPGDSWGSNIKSWSNVLGEFKCRKAELMETGPLKASLLLVCDYEHSQLTEEFVLYRNSPRVHVKVRLLWNQPQCMLKLNFPAKLTHPRGKFSAPYAVVERPTDIGEVPCNGWAAVLGDEGGVGIATKGQYGFDLIESALRLSAVRSPHYGSMYVSESKAPGDRAFMDIGYHEFNYVLTHADDIQAASQHLDAAVHATLGFGHPGTLPPEQSIVRLTPATVELTVFKQAEDANGWVLRMWETSGNAQDVEIHVLDKPVGRFRIKPWELATRRLTGKPGAWHLAPELLTEIPSN